LRPPGSFPAWISWRRPWEGSGPWRRRFCGSKARPSLRASGGAHLARLEAGLAESRASTLAHLDILLTLEEVDQGLARLAGLALEL
jgi:hypothetical protein